jgi:glycosyltransferase involved in cell wall biosynthesis
MRKENSVIHGGIRSRGGVKKQSTDKPLVSVVTVVFNGSSEIENTIRSVLKQKYGNVEYIIVDGCSTDSTLEIVKKYDDKIDYWVSCKDRGIYDAMNFGASLANGVWLNFMNCGDEFFSEHSLGDFLCETSVDFYYSDTVFRRKKEFELVVCSWEKRRFIHQSIIYKKDIHDFCAYLVHPNLTISDYVFFLENIDKIWKKIDPPISLYDVCGISSRPNHFYQKLFVDFSYGRLNRTHYSFIMMFYPTYRFFKLLIFKLTLRGNSSKEI